MIKVEKNGVIKEIPKDLVSAYLKAGWKLAVEKKIVQTQEKKSFIKND